MTKSEMRNRIDGTFLGTSTSPNSVKVFLESLPAGVLVLEPEPRPTAGEKFAEGFIDSGINTVVLRHGGSSISLLRTENGRAADSDLKFARKLLSSAFDAAMSANQPTEGNTGATKDALLATIETIRDRAAFSAVDHQYFKEGHHVACEAIAKAVSGFASVPVGATSETKYQKQLHLLINALGEETFASAMAKAASVERERVDWENVRDGLQERVTNFRAASLDRASSEIATDKAIGVFFSEMVKESPAPVAPKPLSPAYAERIIQHLLRSGVSGNHYIHEEIRKFMSENPESTPPDRACDVIEAWGAVTAEPSPALDTDAIRASVVRAIVGVMIDPEEIKHWPGAAYSTGFHHALRGAKAAALSALAKSAPAKPAVDAIEKWVAGSVVLQSPDLIRLIDNKGSTRVRVKGNTTDMAMLRSWLADLLTEAVSLACPAKPAVDLADNAWDIGESVAQSFFSDVNVRLLKDGRFEAARAQLVRVVKIAISSHPCVGVDMAEVRDKLVKGIGELKAGDWGNHFLSGFATCRAAALVVVGEVLAEGK